MASLSLKVPGRICLFGDKIDLLGKPVIAATIDKFMEFTFETREGGLIHFLSLDYPDEEETFSINDKTRAFAYTNHLKYWHACLKVLEPHIKIGKIGGFSARVKSEIPIGAGLSSSAAVSVGFVKGLNQLFNLGLDIAEVAETAYRAEHDVLGIMCGRMDQYSIAFGGVSFIATGDRPSVDVLEVNCVPLVIGDSCEPREAVKVLNRVKHEVECNNTEYLHAFDAIHDIVMEGKHHLEDGCDLDRIGQLMSLQQVQENVLGAATVKLNMLCEVAKLHGATGAKQMGAGGGGCMLAACRDVATQERVARALNEAGARADMVNVFQYSEKKE